MGRPGAVADQSVRRGHLDSLWEHHIREGRSSQVAMTVQNSQISISEILAVKPFESARGRPEDAALSSHGVTVMQLGEGFWRRGGYLLTGGLLGRASDGPRIFELYGKAVVHRRPYVPFLCRRSPRHETGYEFFLLQRRLDTPRPTMMHQWMVRSDEVVVERLPGGGSEENVRAVLKYEATRRIATITITGLKHPFEERVELPLNAKRRQEKLKGSDL
jgi:hypothetical protein